MAAELLADGWSLVIFPEGGRSPDGWGQPHRAGAAHLAVRTGLPLVPIHVEGTRRILRKGGKGIRPSSTHVTFGLPLVARPGEGARELAARAERDIAVLADEQAHGFWHARQRAARGATPLLTGPPATPWRRAWALGEPPSRRRRTSAWPRF
jgi:1-acyl-sn-glycerol-3-phosphate acyltransferase